MKRLILKTLSICIILFFTGCASYYRPINPPTLSYVSNDLQNGIDMSYRYDVLKEKRNKKLAKNEDRNQVRLVAVKLTNFTDTTINIGQDALFFSGKNQIYPIAPLLMKNLIKQSTPSSLLYLLFTALKLNVYTSSSSNSYPIGYVLGPGLTLLNMTTAASANKNLLKELNQYDLINKDVLKGETVYGLIGIKDNGHNPISLRIAKK